MTIHKYIDFLSIKQNQINARLFVSLAVFADRETCPREETDIMERIEYLKRQVREIQDFPTKGILFRDLTTLFKDHRSVELATDLLVQRYAGKGITKVVGIESRGFIFGSILAYKLNAGFVPVRKKGKLPADKISTTYTLEYGEDSIEMHRDALVPSD